MNVEDLLKRHPCSERFRAELCRELQSVKAQQPSCSMGREGAHEQYLLGALSRLVRQNQMAPYLRLEAVGLLGVLGTECLAALPLLVAMLDDDYGFIRAAACRAVGQIGPAAQIAVDSLRTALADPDPAVQRAARTALDRVCPEEPAPHEMGQTP